MNFSKELEINAVELGMWASLGMVYYIEYYHNEIVGVYNE